MQPELGSRHYCALVSPPDESLLVRQYVEFSVQSTVITAAEMTSVLEMEPDSVTLRGSRFTAPPRPVWHIWTVRADDDADLGAQADQLIARLRPSVNGLRALVERIASDPEDYGLSPTHRGGAVLSVVRYFGDEAGRADRLGWDLSANVLGFLSDLRASVSVDEYDC